MQPWKQHHEGNHGERDSQLSIFGLELGMAGSIALLGDLVMEEGVITSLLMLIARQRLFKSKAFTMVVEEALEIA